MDPDVAEDTNEEDLEHEQPVARPRQLPNDLPKTLDDRRPVQVDTGIEVYDAWQGMLGADGSHRLYSLIGCNRASNISFNTSRNLESIELQSLHR